MDAAPVPGVVFAVPDEVVSLDRKVSVVEWGQCLPCGELSVAQSVGLPHACGVGKSPVSELSPVGMPGFGLASSVFPEAVLACRSEVESCSGSLPPISP